MQPSLMLVTRNGGAGKPFEDVPTSIYNWRAGASQPSRTTGTNFL